MMTAGGRGHTRTGISSSLLMSLSLKNTAIVAGRVGLVGLIVRVAAIGGVRITLENPIRVLWRLVKLPAYTDILAS